MITPAMIQAYLAQKQLDTVLKMKAPITVSFLAQGEYNQNFLLTDQQHRQFVFRLNYGTQINVHNQIKYEYKALEFLANSGVTPYPYYLDDTHQYFEQGVLIEEYLTGHPLRYETDLMAAAEIFAKVHRLPINENQTQFFITETRICEDRIREGEQLLKTVWHSTKIKVEQVKLLAQLRDWCVKHQDNAYFAQQPLSFVNTEVNANNFIIGPQHSWLIDWEKPVISNPVQDLTQFLADTTTLWRTTTILTPVQKQAFMAQYAQVAQVSEAQVVENVQRYMPFLLLRALAWCARLLVDYECKPIQNPEIYAKCQQYLQPEFLTQLFKKNGID